MEKSNLKTRNNLFNISVAETSNTKKNNQTELS